MYGGTKAEMERLLADAEKLTGVKYDPSNFADVIQAIHAVQENLGIAGTTAEEAATTIEGSALAMKAAWENWLTALGNPDADIGAITDQLVDSVIVAASNIIPRIVQILTTLGTVLVEQLPGIIEQLQVGFETYGPPLFEAAKSLFMMILQALMENIPGILTGLLDLLNQLVQFLIDNMPAILDGAIALFGGILTGLAQMAPEILASLLLLLASLIVAIGDKVGEMFDGGMQFITGLLDGIGSVDVLGFLQGIIDSIVGAFSDAGSWLWDAGSSIIDGLLGGLKDTWDGVTGWFADITSSIPNLKGPAPVDAKLLIDNGKLIMQGLGRGLDDGWSGIEQQLKGYTNSIPVTFDTSGTARALTQGMTQRFDAYKIKQTVALDSDSSNALGNVSGIISNRLDDLKQLASRPVVLNVNGRELAYTTQEDYDTVLGKRQSMEIRGFARA